MSPYFYNTIYRRIYIYILLTNDVFKQMEGEGGEREKKNKKIDFILVSLGY